MFLLKTWSAIAASGTIAAEHFYNPETYQISKNGGEAHWRPPRDGIVYQYLKDLSG